MYIVQCTLQGETVIGVCTVQGETVIFVRTMHSAQCREGYLFVCVQFKVNSTE